MSPSSRILLIDELRRAGLPAGARVLIVARDAGRLARDVEAAGFSPATAEPDVPLATAPASCDAAILVDALERTEWDRWLLQQVRRALRHDALLVLVAKNLWSLASPWDAVDLAGRIAGVFARRAVESVAPPAPGAPLASRPFRGHKYRGRILVAMLERLGFEVESCEGGGTSAQWRIRARARDRGVLGGLVPLGACAEHIPAFERENAAAVAAREAWLAANPRHAPSGKVEVLDPAAYAGATAIVLAPHPDDEIIGCGGTILRLARAGCRVVCVQATDGSDGWALRHRPEAERHEVRLSEARAVAQAAGIRESDYWREDNRAFRASEAMVARLAEMFIRLEPRLVFTPFLNDPHRDHRTLNAIAAGAMLASGDALDQARVLGYEVWALAPSSLVCDVTEVREEQEALLRMYENAMKVDDFVDLCERRNYYNACRLLGRAGYAEAFHSCAAADYPTLVTKAYQRSPTASV